MSDTLSIDDVLAPAEGTLLDACRGVGADVPAFCHDPHVTTGAHCRSCIVEVDGRFVAACATPARAGAVVHTQTPRLQAYRRHLGELIRAESDPVGEVGDRLDALGVPPAQAHAGRVDDTHPLLRIDLGRCILCRRCEAVCAEVQGQFVFAVEGRGVTSRVTWGPTPFSETACVSCGACAATCPAGAITDTDRLDPRPVERTVRTTCGYCGVGCQLDVHVGAGAVLSIDGAEADVNRGHLCVKGRYGHGFVGHPDRLRTPLVRRDGALVPVGWEEAIEHVGRELRRLAGHVAGLSSARATNEENYLFQKWIRGGLGSNDVDCCARVCHAPSAAGLKASFGTGAATNCFSDVELADLVMVIGANPTEAHPVMGARIKRAVLEGAGLVVIDPRRTELAAMADVHLAVRPGANVPLLQSIAQVLAAVPAAAGRADWQLLLQLMAATGWPQSLDSPAAILAEVAAVAPLFRGLAFAALDAGQQWPVPAVGHPGSPRLHVDRFTRGLGKLTVVDWHPSPAFDATLQLVTGRVLAHYNAGTMTRRSASLGILDHDALEVHPEDAARAGVADGDRVVVESERGVAYATARVTDRVQPGTLFLSFHFPETQANAVTSDVRDGVTGCPEYKLTGVTLRRADP